MMIGSVGYEVICLRWSQDSLRWLMIVAIGFDVANRLREDRGVCR